MMQRFHAAALLLASSLIGVGPAQARAAEVVVSVTLEWDYRPQSRIIIDQTLWRCADNVCHARILDTAHARQRACYRFARRVGRVLRFETPLGAMQDEELRRCNLARVWRAGQARAASGTS